MFHIQYLLSAPGQIGITTSTLHSLTDRERFMKRLDWAYRVVYRFGFRAARQLWRFTNPRHVGAIALLWHDKRVLLVRNSYQDFWTAPGGGVKSHEAAIDAVIREVYEELGLPVTNRLPDAIELLRIVLERRRL